LDRGGGEVFHWPIQWAHDAGAGGDAQQLAAVLLRSSILFYRLTTRTGRSNRLFVRLATRG
jgi:hypothetical protein